MKKRFLLFALVFLAASNFMCAQVVLNSGNFPDKNFRAALAEALAVEEGGTLTANLLAETTYLELWEMNIRDLTGIGFFTALETLECSGNELTSLDLSKNTSLTYLCCDDNQLQSLTLSGNKALTDLYCSNNQLTSLNLSNNVELVGIGCTNNQLSSLDLSTLTKLETLSVNDNELTSLDFSNNKKLYMLDCYNNKINGVGMDKLINSLPKATSEEGEGGILTVISSNAKEGNVCTTKHVADAKAKLWDVYIMKDEDWEEYAGSDITGIDNVEVGKKDVRHGYTLDGRRVGASSMRKGLYVVDGKKVLFKQ